MITIKLLVAVGIPCVLAAGSVVVVPLAVPSFRAVRMLRAVFRECSGVQGSWWRVAEAFEAFWPVRDGG